MAGTESMWRGILDQLPECGYSGFVPARSTNTPAEEVAQSLEALAVPATALSDALVKADGRHIPVDSRRSVSQTEAEGLSRKHAGGIIVADRISAEARRVLADGRVGWLDCRGHMQLRGDTVHIDADVPPLVAPESHVSGTSSSRPGWTSELPSYSTRTLRIALPRLRH